MQPPETEQTWTVGNLLDWTAKFLQSKGSDSPRLDAEVLLAKSLDCRRIDLYGELHGEIAGTEIRETYRDLIRRRIEGCPVAYLVGKKEFFSMKLEVSPAVLIPRPDSELVVIACLELARELAEPRILDIGTGSGNLAIALAVHLPEAVVFATDISPEALEIAKKNAVIHQVEERVHLVDGNLFEPVSSKEPFDFLVSNPPYIAEGELAELESGVRDYEPKLALNGGESGFEVFDALIENAPQFLKPGGYLFIEIGAPQEEPARTRIQQKSCYRLFPTIHDYSGHPRVLKVQLIP